MSAAAIALDGLTKYYGRVTGLEGLTLRVEPGEVFGFIGANGAGKTTARDRYWQFARRDL